MSTKVGIQLVYTPREEEDGDSLFDLSYPEGAEWSLVDMRPFGDNAEAVDSYAQALGYAMLYTEFIHEHITDEIYARIRNTMSQNNYGKRYHEQVTLAVVLEPWWEEDVDWESGIDEGGYCFEYLGLLKMEVQG
jgi:hypothetical protein